MNPAAPYRNRVQKIGEISLWTGASVLVLSAHIAAAALLMQEEPITEADSAPPAAIMIELAPEPEAVNTEEEQISPDMADSEKVDSEQPEPVEEVQKEPEPIPDPVEPPPEEVVEEQPTPPEPEIAEPLPEPPPEPIEEPDPLEQQMTAALENVEVPLPIVRPPPPPEVAEKPEPKKDVKKVERRKPQQQQAQKEMAQAKAQVRQSDRNAASQSSTGSVFASSVSPAKWMTRVRAKIARSARRCPGGDRGVVTVSFSFDNGGNIGRVSVSRSSGSAQIDDYVTSAIRKASPIPAPPSGVASSLTQPVECK